MAARAPMTTITTNNSTIVKPIEDLLLELRVNFFISYEYSISEMVGQLQGRGQIPTKSLHIVNKIEPSRTLFYLAGIRVREDNY